jgi:hypothetical protein
MNTQYYIMTGDDQIISCYNSLSDARRDLETLITITKRIASVHAFVGRYNPITNNIEAV